MILFLVLPTKTVPEEKDCVENVEHSQDYQQLVEHGPDEPGLGEDDDGQGVHGQAGQAEESLETKNIISYSFVATVTWHIPSSHQLRES